MAELSWLIPICMVLCPLALLLGGVALESLGINGKRILPFFWLFFLTAPFIGLLTLIVMHVQGNLKLLMLKQRHICAVFLFACMNIVSPLYLIIILLILFDLDS